MNPIRVIIADDDSGMRLIMRRLVEKAEGYEIVGEAVNGKQLIEMYDEMHPEVILLDVEMPEMTGVECARAIQDRDPRTIMVFATAHEEYMANAFEVYAFDYLVKPFRVERAMKTLDRIRDRLRVSGVQDPVAALKPRKLNGPGRMMLKHRDGVSFLDISDIALVMRENRSTVLVMEDGTRYVVSDALGELEERLPEEIFFRTHKSYIVNLNLVDSISPYGRWTYIIKLRGLNEDALITHERFEALQKLFA
ncbi:MAG: response regulator transcription factor [Clostridia bacterium]|nr:response regulator transcription factor [Clostridia bacterium]